MKRSTMTTVTTVTGAMMLALSAGHAVAAPGEIRVVGRALLIEGLDDPSYNDMIEVVEDGVELWVRAIGSTVGGFRVPIADVDEIKVALWSGNDTFQAPDLDLPMIVDGGYGDDHIHTGRGNDSLFGREGYDTLSGDEGDDWISGGDWADTINGGPGNDTIYGFYPVSSAADLLYCYQDDDTIDAGPGSDYVEGGPYNDEIHAGAEDGLGTSVDTVYGYVNTPDATESLTIDPCEDKDTITADGTSSAGTLAPGGSLIAYAGPDDDTVLGSKFGDVISGDSGDDTIYAYESDDTLSGGPGTDFIDCGEGDDSADGGSGPDEIWGQGGSDTLHGGSGDDSVMGNADDDTLWGDAGADSLQGGDGEDTLRGGAHNDTMKGGTGNDTMYGNGGDDLMYGYAGDDTMSGGTGNDVMSGHAGNDELDGDDGADTLDGGDGEDELVGGVTDHEPDSLSGGADNDRLYGGGGEDSLSGGDGDDLLVAVDSDEDDTLTGGSGFDSFWYDKANRVTDKVTDATESEEETNVHEVRSIQNFDDYTWDGDDITDMSAGSGLTYADFSGQPLFPADGPQLQDVNQGATGSCWLLAGLGAVATVNQNAIYQTIIPLPDGSFMMQWGKRHYRHDADLPTTSGGQPAYANLGSEGSLWVAMIEKMVADRRFSTGDISFWNEYNDVAFGTPATTFRKMGGDGRSLFEAITSEIFGSSPWDLAYYIERTLDNDEAVAVCTPPILIGSDRLYKSHCYTVLRVIRSGGWPSEIELYNPWGIDVAQADIDSGAKTAYGANDGIIRVSVSEFWNTFISTSTLVSMSDFSAFDE